MPDVTPALPAIAVMPRLLEGVVLSAVVLTAYKLLKAAQAQPGLLSANSDGDPSAGRVVSMTTTIVTAVAYAAHCLLVGAGADTLPEPPHWIVWMAAGGQLSYIAQKINALIERKF